MLEIGKLSHSAKDVITNVLKNLKEADEEMKLMKHNLSNLEDKIKELQNQLETKTKEIQKRKDKKVIFERSLDSSNFQRSCIDDFMIWGRVSIIFFHFQWNRCKSDCYSTSWKSSLCLMRKVHYISEFFRFSKIYDHPFIFVNILQRAHYS